MATWHQQRAKVVLFHETDWTIVNDPPNQCTTLSRFSTEDKAKETLETWQKNNPDAHRHCYILPPARK